MSERSRHRRRGKKPPPVYSDWLPADDDANQHRYWVPTPAEIEQMKAELRAAPRGRARQEGDLDNALSRVPVRRRPL